MDDITNISCIIFQNETLLVADGSAVIDQTNSLETDISITVEHDDQMYLVKELDEYQAIPTNLQQITLRALMPELVKEELELIIKAKNILNFYITHQYCGKCGASTIDLKENNAKQCSQCDAVYYPRISPSVIVLITKGNQILLGRSPHFRPGMYSNLAGFVEPGETAEQAVAREVFEEVGLHVKNINYVCSQAWPFPSSLIFAFTAEYASGEISVDEDEIEDAQWFSRDNLPDTLPMKTSISRKLLNLYLENNPGK